jgi:hypothetical protein
METILYNCVSIWMGQRDSKYHLSNAKRYLYLFEYSFDGTTVAEVVSGGPRPFKGDVDEAKAALAKARRINLKVSVKWLIKHKPALQLRLSACARRVVGGVSAPRFSRRDGAR